MRNQPGYRTKRFWLPIVLMALAFVGLFINNAAHADTITVYISSEHVSNSPYEFNENNIGLGYGYTYSDNLRVIAGGFKNSSYKESYYGGVELYKRFNTPISEVGIDAGFISGYNMKYPVGVAAYARIIDAAKVSVSPIVIDGEMDGYVLGFALTLGK